MSVRFVFYRDGVENSISIFVIEQFLSIRFGLSFLVVGDCFCIKDRFERFSFRRSRRMSRRIHYHQRSRVHLLLRCHLY